MPRQKKSDEPPLIQAVMSRKIRRVRELLAEGADPNTVSTRGEAALTLAAGEREIALALIEAGADIGKADRGRINPVWAVTTGRVDVVARVLDAGGELNCKTMLGTPLHVAAREGMAGILRLLIERGADVNAGTTVGKPLYDAVQRNHPECVRLLLDAGAHLEVVRGGRDTLLTRAVHNRSPEVVAALLAAGAAPDERGMIVERVPDTFTFRDLYANATPLAIAARLGETRIAETLLQAGADPDLRDEDGNRPLDLAREHGHADLVPLLESVPKAVEAPSEEDLFLAAEQGDAPRVRDLIAAGVDVDARDRRSRSPRSTPLMLAARGGHVDVVAALLAAGASVEFTDAEEGQAAESLRRLYREIGDQSIREMGLTLGRAALHEAAATGYETVAAALLAAGAAADQPDTLGLTPLMLAAAAGHAGLVRVLLAAGASVKAVDADRDTALTAAVRGGSAECVALLLAAGARIPGGRKHNLLARAARGGSAAMVEALVRGGANVDATDQFGNTPLIEAAEAGHVEVVRQLIALEADVNHRNESGDTALIRGVTPGVSATEYEAMRQRQDPLLLRKVEMARALLDAGADVNAVSRYNQSALAMAAYSLNEPLVRFLLNRGANPNLGSVGEPVLQLARRHRFAPDLIERLAQAAANLPAEAPSPPAPEPAAPVPAPPEPPRAREALPPPDFSVAREQSEFRQALADVEAWCGTKAVEFEHAPGAYHLHVDSRSGFDFEPARRELLARGFMLLWLDVLEHQQVGLFPTTDPFAVLLAMGTNGANYDLGPEEVVAWLRELHAEQPFEITGVRYDLVEGRFLGEVREPRRLAKRMYAFCPDIVDQGVGTVAALARLLQKERTLYFWWD